MAGTVKVDLIQADTASDLTLRSGIASKPPVIRDGQERHPDPRAELPRQFLLRAHRPYSDAEEDLP